MDPELRKQVLAIYELADAEVAAAGPVCESSGRCCRFTEYGHTLFLSEIEAEVLLETAPPFDRVSPDGCPFQMGNLCTARVERPLGCRVYYCDPRFKEQMPLIMEAGIQRLKQLCEKTGRTWRYAPLHEFLGQSLASGRRSLPMVDS